MIDKILDKYFAKKVVNLVQRHLETNQQCLQFCNGKSIAFRDFALKEYTVFCLRREENVIREIPYIEFREQESVEVLFRLLTRGWGELDRSFANRLPVKKESTTPS